MSVSPSVSPSAQGLFSNPYLLLVLTVAMWGGHSVVSRMAVGEISPASLTCLRWLVVASIMFTIAGRGLREHWRALKPRLGYLAAMGTLGYTGYNILLYWSAHYTTAINLNIINGAMPALIFMFALAIFRQKITPLQWIGTAVSMTGVAVVAAKGDFTALLALTINRGDIFIFIATALYAGYSVLLRNKPPVPSMVLFTVMASAAFLSSTVVLGVEVAVGEFYWPSGKGWLLLLYVAIFPSLLSQLFFMRAIELIGAGRAGLFTNLMPLFGASFAMLILGEELALYHAVALALVLGGILLAELKRGR